MSALCCDAVSDIRPMPPVARGTSEAPSESELFRAARYECDRHKWFESERAGHDVGRSAYKNWKCTHWWRWCRERLIEHLSGQKYWSELDQKDYGLLNRDFHNNPGLALTIVNKIKL